MNNLTFCCTSGVVSPDDYLVINAFKTWARLGVDVHLWGPDNDEFKELLSSYNITLHPEGSLSESGLPFLDSLLDSMLSVVSTDYMCYINADIMIFPDFLASASFLQENVKDFFMVGQRYDWFSPHLISDSWTQKDIQKVVSENGAIHDPCGIDYFLFKTDFLRGVTIPPFIVPKFRWDQWFIGLSKVGRIPLIDATATVQAIHSDPISRHVRPDSDELYNDQLFFKADTWKPAPKGFCSIVDADFITSYNADQQICLSRKTLS
mgnify:CR=1 FL=1|tara:strand:+ start:1786 stop:2577 length:792 start_codon:yes stop_codon:yes gene_type:complete